jgi:hypothetical protein
MPRNTAKGPNIWVVRRATRFSITEENSGDYLIPPVSQKAAVSIGRLLARANKSELIVQGQDGRIRIRDSHGADPFPPKG